MMTSTSPRRFSSSIAATISAAAVSPCTRTGLISTRTSAKRRPMTLRMSRIAAPDGEVTIPILPGSSGIGLLRAGSKSPSSRSRSFNCSKASWSAPTPFGSISDTVSW